LFNATLRFGIFCLAIGCSLLVKAQGADVSELRAYGPGGPLEPIRECARAFSNQEGVQVTVTGEPEEQWIAQARKDADVVFGGADYMLTQLTLKYPDLINPLTRTELYTRGAVILVRKGNPKNIAEFKDLARPGVKIVDVNGAGQVGLWEDIASLAGVADPQKQIALSVTSSAAAVNAWRADPSLDAWVTYRTWHYRLPQETEIVEIEKNCRPSRATPIAIAKTCSHPALARKFIDYLKSDAGKAIFQKWGYN
jgi:accessory colonization factor AcfC